jgi:hypothetical protein
MTLFRGQACMAKNDVIQGQASSTGMPHDKKAYKAEELTYLPSNIWSYYFRKRHKYLLVSNRPAYYSMACNGNVNSKVSYKKFFAMDTFRQSCKCLLVINTHACNNTGCNSDIIRLSVVQKRFI